MDATGLYFIEREASSIRFIVNSSSEAARITSAGNVGIGTTSPGAQLQVSTAAAATKGLIVKGFTSQTAPLLVFQNSSGDTIGYRTATGTDTASFVDFTWTPNYSGGVSSPSTGTYQKTSGNNNTWDGQVYSSEGFAKNVYVSFKASQTNTYEMMGLNADPASDASYTGLDYAWFPTNSGTSDIYESNVSVGSFGSYTTSTNFSIVYDGTTVYYLKDGAIMRSVARAISGLLYLDSSFYGLNGALNSVKFGPSAGTDLAVWAGSANITTLGTVGTGTWNATAISTAKGGTALTSIGTANQVLGVNSGATGLEYKTITAGSGVSITHGANSVTIAATGGTGTVTSVSGTGTVSGITLTGTVTSSGNLTLGGTLSVAASNFASQTANTVLAAPNGAAGTPTFRALVAADIPTLNQNTTGTASGSVSGTASYLAKFTSTNVVGNSLISDNGTNILVGTQNPTYLGRFNITSSVQASTTTGIVLQNFSSLGLIGLDLFNDGNKEAFIGIGGSGYAAPYGDNVVCMAYGSVNLIFGTVGAERMRINSQGNVGIGTASPSSRFDVNTGTGANFRAAFAATNQVEIGNYSAASGYRELLIAGSPLTLYTGTAGAGSVSERVRIDSSGNVGIGTSTSLNGISTPLHVNAVSSYGSILSSQATATVVADSGGELQFAATYRTTFGGGDLTQVARIRGLRENATASNWAGYLAFYTSTGSDNPSASTERMRINSSGNVGIGTKVPANSLVIATNGPTPAILIYKSPDGVLRSAQQVAALGTGGSASNSGTTGGNEYGILNLFMSGVARCQLYAYAGGGGYNNYVLDGMSFGQTSAAAGQVVVAPVSAATKGLIVKGFTSQNASLQEWQNSTPTTLAYVDSAGGAYFPYISTASISTDLEYLGLGKTSKTFVRTVPTAPGDYVEITTMGEFGGPSYEINVVTYHNSGEYSVNKRYFFMVYFAATSGTITPIAQYGIGSSPVHDFELEAYRESAGIVVLRLRRTKNTNSTVMTAYISITEYDRAGQGLPGRTGTGTSGFGTLGGYTTGSAQLPRLTPAMVALDPVGLTGAGTPVALYAGSAFVTGAGGAFGIYGGNATGTGAGGSIILQPGAQATSGGNGVVIVRQPGGTAGTDEGQVYHDGTNLYIVNKEGGAISNSIRLQTNAGYGVSVSNFGDGAFSYLSATSGTLVLGYGSTVYLSYWNVNGTTGDLSPNIQGYALRFPNTGGFTGYLSGAGVVRVIDTAQGGGSLAFTNSSPGGYTGDQTDLVLNGSAFQRLSGTAARSIFSIAPPSGGSHVDGRMIRIYNVGTFNLTLKHNYTTGTTQANRMFCVQSADIVIATNDFAELIYDGTNNGSGAAGWRVA